jgi:hypothetical protein
MYRIKQAHRILVYYFVDDSATAEDRVAEDEEWGWGDDDDDDTGHVELSSTTSGDSFHRRRSPSTESSNRTPVTKTTTKSIPGVQNSFIRSSPAATRNPVSGDRNAPIMPQQIPASTSGRSSSFTSSSTSKPGLALSKPPPPSFQSPSTAPVPSAASQPPATPLSDFGNLGGMKITSLGPVRSNTMPSKKPPAPAPPPEDDIFASMGLLAKPTFSHSTPAPAPAPSAPSSRWSAAVPLAAASSSASAMVGTRLDAAEVADDDGNWDDDGDLDDLFED